jgi:transcriptional regulator with XRE-family HTH domain
VRQIKQAQKFALAIRAVRSRLRDTQAEFAERLGSSQNTISQYENGKINPSAEILAKVWHLADATERRLLQAHVSALFSMLEPEQQRRLLSEASDLFSSQAPDKQWSTLQDVSDDARSGGLSDPVRSALHLVRFRRLCDQYAGDPDADDLFERAAAWLETEFAMRRLCRPKEDPHESGTLGVDEQDAAFAEPHSQSTATGVESVGATRNSYRLTLPIDLGDGVVHQPGELIDLDLATAKLYSHALIRVEPVRRPKKKSA